MLYQMMLQSKTTTLNSLSKAKYLLGPRQDKCDSEKMLFDTGYCDFYCFETSDNSHVLADLMFECCLHDFVIEGEDLHCDRHTSVFCADFYTCRMMMKMMMTALKMLTVAAEKRSDFLVTRP